MVHPKAALRQIEECRAAATFFMSDGQMTFLPINASLRDKKQTCFLLSYWQQVYSRCHQSLIAVPNKEEEEEGDDMIQRDLGANLSPATGYTVLCTGCSEISALRAMQPSSIQHFMLLVGLHVSAALLSQ